MALDIASQVAIGTVDANVNAPDVVSNYNNEFYGRTVLIPKGVGQVGAFTFDYRGTDEINIDTEITDHWLEDNTAVQDHIGVKPTIVTVRGFVAELNLSGTTLSFINKALSSVANSLTQVPSYLGHYTPGTIDNLQKAISQAQNIAIQIEQAAARAAQIAAFFPHAPAMNRQQAAYFQLSSLARARVVFTVIAGDNDNPFQVFDNMAIMSLRTVQPENIKGWSDFTVKMKQLQFTEDISLPVFTANNAGRTASQAQPGTQNGATQGTPVPASTVTGAF